MSKAEDKKNAKILARNLKTLRAYHGLSQIVLAKKAGVSLSTIVVWERPGTRAPSHNNLAAVAKALGVHPELIVLPMAVTLVGQGC